MISFGNQTVCELCFSPVSRDYPICSCCDSISNLNKYRTALKEGTVLVGRYLIGRVLGKGGFGTTYLCYDLKDNCKVAIKEYFPDTFAYRDGSASTHVAVKSESYNEKYRLGEKKFFQEATTVSKFSNHPNIVHVSNYFRENNTAYYVMEYLDGMDLKGYVRMRGGKISENEAIGIIMQVLEALDTVHKNKILHRDISPDNIFICKQGGIKLIDFGAAREFVEDSSSGMSVILKKGFAPFEQYRRDGNQGPWSDIYALGGTLYYIISGNVPPDAVTRASEDTLSLEGFSRTTALLLKGMLAVSVSKRFKSVSEVKHAVYNLDSSYSASLTSTSAEAIKKSSAFKLDKFIGLFKKDFKSIGNVTDQNDLIRILLMIILICGAIVSGGLILLALL